MHENMEAQKGHAANWLQSQNENLGPSPVFFLWHVTSGLLTLYFPTPFYYRKSHLPRAQLGLLMDAVLEIWKSVSFLPLPISGISLKARPVSGIG